MITSTSRVASIGAPHISCSISAQFLVGGLKCNLYFADHVGMAVGATVDQKVTFNRSFSQVVGYSWFELVVDQRRVVGCQKLWGVSIQLADHQR